MMAAIRVLANANMLTAVRLFAASLIVCFSTASWADSKDQAGELIERGWKAWGNTDPRAALDAFKRAGELGDPAGYYFAHLLHKNLPLAKASFEKHRYHLLDDEKAYDMESLAWKRGYPEAVWGFARNHQPEARKTDYEKQWVRENQARWEQAALALRYPPALAYFADENFRKYMAPDSGMLVGLGKMISGRAAYVLSMSTLEHALLGKQDNKLRPGRWNDAIKTALRISAGLKAKMTEEEIRGHEKAFREHLDAKPMSWAEIAEQLRLSVD